MLLKSCLKNARISTKFKLSLILLFVIGILGGATLSTVLQQRAQAKVINTNYTQEQTKIAEQFIEQFRKHPEIHPELKDFNFRRFSVKGKQLALYNYQCAVCHTQTPRSHKTSLVPD